MGILSSLFSANPAVAAGEAAGSAAGALLTGVGDFAIKIRQAIKGKELDPAVAAHLEELAMQAEQLQSQGQLAVNLEEAKSEKWWKAGWRPNVGWACGAAVWYTYVLQPTFSFVVQAVAWQRSPVGTVFPTFPALNMQDILGLLGALLGMGWLRSVDKRAGVQ